MAWNPFVQLIAPRAADASAQHLRRPNLAGEVWLFLSLTAPIVIVVVWGFRCFARNGSFRELLSYALFFAIVEGLLVDLDQYVLFPIPAVVAAGWLIGGLVRFKL